MPHDPIERALIANNAALLAEVIRDEWSTPIPLAASEPNPVPPGLLPGALGEFVEALTEHTETPRELGAMMCLAVASASAAGRYEVLVREGYIEPLNVFTAVALESGARKTAVVNGARSPLIKFEHEEQQRLLPERRQAISERKTLEGRIEKLRKEVMADPTDEMQSELRGLEEGLVEIPEFPRLWTQDCTPEALAVLAAKNNERMLVMSDEGGIFDILAGRYSRGVPNLDFVLQAHAGSAVRIDRKAGDPLFLARPLLTVALSPQPSVLQGLADVPGFRGRGLLARFLFAVAKSNLGYRHHEARPIPAGIQEDWNALIYRLLKSPINVGSNGSPAATRLTFAPSAYASWHDFQRLVEVQMREGNQLAGLRDWAGKLPGVAARIAGVLHCVTMDTSLDTRIPLGTTEVALQLAAILISHALAAFGLMGADANAGIAGRVIRWASERGEAETTERDVFCAFQGTVKTMANLEPVLRLLEKHRYLRIEDRPTKGRPSSVCVWNPAVVGGGSDE
jgi:hypothetical protein